jgi:hypothetical protein
MDHRTAAAIVTIHPTQIPARPWPAQLAECAPAGAGFPGFDPDSCLINPYEPAGGGDGAVSALARNNWAGRGEWSRSGKLRRTGARSSGKSSLMRYLLDEEKVRDTNALGF